MKKGKLWFQMKSSRKLFFSVLVTYLLLLGVTLSLLVGGYTYSIKKTKQDMETLQTSYLGLICRELDTRLSAVSKISSFLASYPLTKYVAKIEDESVEYQLDYRSLNEVITEQNTLLQGAGETIIYFDASDSILTGEYRYRNVNLDAYTKQLGLTEQEFRDFLSYTDFYGALRILYPGTEKAQLIYVAPIFDSDYHKMGSVVTRLTIEYLKSAINVEHWVKGSICHMQNGDETLCIESGNYGDLTIQAQPPLFSGVPLDGSLVQIDIGGKDYMTMGLRSTFNSWKYYFSVPVAELHRANRLFIMLFVVVLMLSLLSGVSLSLAFSRHFSKPLQGILDNLKLDKSMDYPEAVSTLERAITSYRKELTDTKGLLYQRTQKDKEDFVYGICTGRVDVTNFAEGMKKYGLSLENGPTLLIQFWYIGVENSVFAQDGVLDINLLLYASCNVIDELLCRERGVTFSRENYTICLCQSSLSRNTDELQEKLEELRRFHQEVLQVELRVFCAGCGKNLSDLPELMEKAEYMVHYKTFWNQETPDILFYEEVDSVDGIEGTTDYLGVEKRFINLLAIKDYEGAHQLLIQQLEFGISKNMERFQLERFKVFGLISSFLETMTADLPAEMDREEMEKMNLILRSLLIEPSLNGLKEKIDRLFQLVISRREEASASDIPPWVVEIRSYIETHYDDPQLDVSYLSRKFAISVSYLSRTYKKITSIGVLDNIHMVRIARAKEFLDNGVNVSEASARVGYQESRALIRAFKRYEGITPGQYQEMASKQNS